MAQKDSQEAMIQFRMMEARLETMVKQRDMVVNRLAEIENTIAGVEEVAKAKGDVLFHVGGEAFLPAKPVQDGSVVVMIGADVALEKTVPEAKTMLESRLREAQNVLGQIEAEIENLSKTLESMVPGMQSLQSR